MRRLITVMFVSLSTFCSPVMATEPSVIFLAATPKGCRSMGQLVGAIDKGIYDKWSLMRLGYVEFSPAYMQEMKKQAAKIGANRVVFDKLNVEYLVSDSARRGRAHSLKNGTYTAKGYRCS